MSHSEFDFEKNKLQQWKNAPLVDDEYFDKLPLCVMQRIQMNEEMKKDALHFKPVVTYNKKNHRILYYLSGTAAALLICLGLLYRNTSFTEQHASHDSTNTNKNNEKALTQEAATEYKNGSDLEKEKHSIEKKTSDCVPEASSKKRNPSSSDPFETALQTITDEELEELNWTLYLNETL
jgi:hypothetical protein